MDTADFVLKRQDLQRSIEGRRSEITQRTLSARSGVIPWMMLTGASMVSGVRSSPGARRLLRTIAWATLAPIVLGVVNRHNDGFLHRLFEAIFPSSHRKETASQ